jgi:outer membrane protein
MSERKMMKILISAGLLCAFSSLAVQAQETPPEGDKSTWLLGIGGGLQKKIYAGSDTKFRVLPLLTYENSWVKVAGPGVGLKLGRSGGFSYMLNARYALGDGYKSSDAWVLEGMNKRKASVWVGPEVSWDSDFGRLSAGVQADASQKSEGYQATLNYSRDFRFGRFSIGPNVGLSWLSSQYVDYYYGVTEAEATNWRSQYEGKASLNLGVGLRGRYMIDAHQFASFELGVKHYGSGITDSPLVDRRYQPQLSLGYAYRF